MCLGVILYSIVDLLIITSYTRRVIDTGFLEQISLIFPTFFVSVTMGAIIYIVQGLVDNNLLKLLSGVIIGISYYFICSFMFKLSELNQLLFFIKKS